MELRKDPNLYIAIFTAIAAICSLWSVWSANAASKEAEKLSRKSETRQSMITYLRLYETISHTVKITGINSEDEYNKLTPENRSSVNIVAGLLVSVVDAMYDSDDERAAKWATYIKCLQGPLMSGFPLEVYASFPLEVYASNEKTKKAIDKAKIPLLAGECNKTGPAPTK